MPKLSAYRMYRVTPTHLKCEKYYIGDDSFVLQETYNLYYGELESTRGTIVSCSCIAWTSECRHKKMVPLFEQRQAFNTARFLVWDPKGKNTHWIPPFIEVVQGQQERTDEQTSDGNV